MKSVYILLTKTNTIPARIIRKVNGDTYSHASLALDKELTELYSFARRNIRFPLIAGFIREDIDVGIFARNGDAPCALYELEINDDTYEAIQSRIKDMLNNYDAYKYNILGLLLYNFGIPIERRYHFVCSQFVAHILYTNGALKFPKKINLIRPADFCDLPELHEVYKGRLRNVKSHFLSSSRIT